MGKKAEFSGYYGNMIGAAQNNQPRKTQKTRKLHTEAKSQDSFSRSAAPDGSYFRVVRIFRGSFPNASHFCCYTAVFYGVFEAVIVMDAGADFKRSF
jgi:hypothetical protein